MRLRDPLWPTAADWLGQNNAAAPPPETELAVLGVPLSVTSITQPAGAHETPEAVRRRLAFLSTYHSERDVDVGELAAVDFGDLTLQPSNKEIASAARDVVRQAPMAVLLGADAASGPQVSLLSTNVRRRGRLRSQVLQSALVCANLRQALLFSAGVPDKPGFGLVGQVSPGLRRETCLFRSSFQISVISVDQR